MIFGSSSRTLCLLTGLLAAISAIAQASHKVVDLSDGFASRIGDYDTALVKFYAPWCGHCKRLAPIFEEASNQLSAGTLVKVDCTSDGAKAVCEQYQVRGYPTLKLFRKGEFVENYENQREIGDIISYVENHALPAITEISSLDGLSSLLNDKQTFKGLLMGYFDSDQDNKGLKTLKDIADHKFNVRFAYSVDPAINKHYGHSNEIVLYMAASIKVDKLEATEIVYSGRIDSPSDLQQFMIENRNGHCAIRTEENRKDFEGSPYLVVYLNTDLIRNAQDVKYSRNRVVKAAKQLKEKYPAVKYAISDSAKFEDELERAGVHHDRTGKHTIMYDKDGQRFLMDKTFSADNIVSFVTSVLEGELEPSLKSEDIPKEPVEDGVHVIVAKNYKQLVADANKDVLIEFYAPWCGHCKKLAPILSEVAKELQENSDQLIIAKMNAVDNDVPSRFEVNGYPTIYFIPKNNPSNLIPYSGAREKEDFIRFLAKHSSEPLKTHDRSGNRMVDTTKEL